MARLSPPALILALTGSCASPCIEREVTQTENVETVPALMVPDNVHEDLVNALEINLDGTLQTPFGCGSQLNQWTTETQPGTLIKDPELISTEILAVRIGLSVSDAPDVKECKEWLNSQVELDEFFVRTNTSGHYYCEKTKVDVVRPFPERLTQQDIVITFLCYTGGFNAKQLEHFKYPLSDPNSLNKQWY